MRAIHYYDQIGLVRPSARTAGGHRVYGDLDVQRLCVVALLRMAGLSTVEIEQHLAEPDWSLSQIVSYQLRRLDRQLIDVGTLRNRLIEVAAADPATVEPGFLAAAQRSLATPYLAHNAVAVLPYADVDAARQWLGDVFGLPPGPPNAAGPISEGTTQYASVLTGQGLIHLHRASDGFRPPGRAGNSTAMVVITVDDVDHLARQIKAKGGRLTHGPADMAYGVREFGTADLEGHIWCFHQTLAMTGDQQ